jgi:hypothetical protein
MKIERGLAVGSKSGAFPSSIWLEVVGERDENNNPGD